MPEEARTPPRARADPCPGPFLATPAVPARTESRYVVQLYDANVTDGVAWMALELLSGQPLDEVLATCGTLNEQDTLRITDQVADGVYAIHLLGALHRDLKPANVFVTDSGEAKVLDLGTTKIIGGALPRDRPSTDIGSVIGTFTFMSPEQLLGERVGFKSDIYALGVLAYLTLTGHHPFEGEEGIISPQALAYRAAMTEPHPIARFQPSCPAEICAFIGELLAKDPDRRPASMAEVASRARLLRAARMAELGLDPDSGIEHLLSESGTGDRAITATTDEMGDQTGSEPPAGKQNVDHHTAGDRTPAGTVRMEPVPEEVNEYLRQAARPPEARPLHGERAMADEREVAQADPTEPMAALELDAAAVIRASSSAGMAVATRSGLKLRPLGQLPRWLKLAVALIASGIVMAVVWWVRSERHAAEPSPGAGVTPDEPATEPTAFRRAAPIPQAPSASSSSGAPVARSASSRLLLPPAPASSGRAVARPSRPPAPVTTTSKSGAPPPAVYPESLD
ncbi:MAG: hypothetical protein DRI90_24780 [Deltaproteobacteria bacterium]|nr:MAG: hypothetical protein DRI90_24780 [Deltaproteobacteria bacterium]